MPFTYEYPHPSVTVDVALFGERNGERVVLLIERKHEPFKGAWAIPGGFVDENEGLDAAARRELHEETGLETAALAQVGAFGDPGRDPRGHTVSVLFVAEVDVAKVKPVAADDAAKAEWHAVTSLGLEDSGKAVVKLAFDHDRLLRAAWHKLTG